jgi:hypothetical protein
MGGVLEIFRLLWNIMKWRVQSNLVGRVFFNKTP